MFHLIFSNKSIIIALGGENMIKTTTMLADELKEECYLLFSPGATSFAMFNNEFHRGDEFNRLVMSIINK